MHYRSALSTRKLQVAGLPVNVADVATADLVRDWLASGVLSEAVQDILDAVGKGFSVCEIVWDVTGKQWIPAAVLWCDPRWFIFDHLDGTTLRLRGENGLPEPLVPYK